MIDIRQAVPGDAAALCLLNEEFNGAGTPREYIAAALAEQGDELTLIALDDGQAVGFLCARCIHSWCYTRPHGEITEMYVVPLARRRGVATALIRRAEQQLANRGVCTLRIATGRQNAAAQRLYAACGYAVEDEVFMEKALDRMP